MRNCANELARALSKTSEFKEMKNAKKEIDSDRELKSMIEDYTKKQAAVFKSAQPSELERKLDNLNREFSRLMKKPGAARFFTACKAFNSLMAGAYRSINHYLDSKMV